jgi:hypothetical protein
LGVQRAQPYLIGGSGDTWGFGQILALSLLVIPTVEKIKYAFKKAKEEPSFANLDIGRLKRWNHLERR